LKKWVKTKKDSSVEKTDSNIQEKKSESKEKKEVHRCDACKWYDVSTQRDFFRKVGPRDKSGQRATIKEIRAVCRSPNSKAKGHLVKNDSNRPCFEKGVYVEEKMTSPEEYFGTPEGRLKTKSKGSKPVPTKQSNHSARKKKVVATNLLNNKTKVLQQRDKRVFITAGVTSTLR
jgi:hypothetical protein